MAGTIAYLQGGPCDGTTHTITPAEGDTGEIVCKGSIYRVVSPATFHNGHPIFAYVGKVPPPHPPPKLKATQALNGWADLRKSINRGMPAALTYSQHVTSKSLRTLARARKVRI